MHSMVIESAVHSVGSKSVGWLEGMSHLHTPSQQQHTDKGGIQALHSKHAGSTSHTTQETNR